MIPSPWVAVVLALAAFRLTRLVGWDDLPPIQRVRDWLTGARHVQTSSPNAGFTMESPSQAWVYSRPLLAHFITCPFCVGFWISLGVYLAWRFEPTDTLYACAPLAISAAVGLIAKNLDP